jgi:hypothetical protein
VTGPSEQAYYVGLESQFAGHDIMHWDEFQQLVTWYGIEFLGQEWIHEFVEFSDTDTLYLLPGKTFEEALESMRMVDAEGRLRNSAQGKKRWWNP